MDEVNNCGMAFWHAWKSEVVALMLSVLGYLLVEGLLVLQTQMFLSDKTCTTVVLSANELLCSPRQRKLKLCCDT